MRVPPTPLLIILAVCLLCDIYIYICLRKRISHRIFPRAYIVLSAIIYCVLGVALLIPRRDGDNSMLLEVMWMLYSVLTILIAKFAFVIFDLIACIPRLWHHRRIRTISHIGVVALLVVLCLMLWGAFVNRFNINVIKIDFDSPSLPANFDGYKIVQLSDLHVGTFGNDTSFIDRLVNEVNSLQPDLIVFTGDIVNMRSDELRPHSSSLSRLSAPDGVLSILGNHDYGDYSNWSSPEAKENNLKQLIDLQTSMSWKMLNNASVTINRGTDSIAIIGVENIGDPPFKVYGSLDKAYRDVSDPVFKILLSHNPAHWDDSISGYNNVNIPLTLSGHTHAMQMEICGFSPAAFRYRDWGGLYTDTDSTHSLYVNIGAGCVGFPARIGATPEITLITLRKSK